MSNEASNDKSGIAPMMVQIRADLTAAMKARDALKMRTLRAIVAAVQEAQVAESSATSLNDDDIQKVIAAQAKRRVEAAEAFDEGDRPEKAQDERDELAVLETYLPKALDEAELVAIVESTLKAEGVTAKADMGKAMKAVNAQVAGRADGKKVAELVKERLS